MNNSGVTITATATVITPEQEVPPMLKRVARKIHCNTLVANLVRSWQGWASQHSQQQESLPSGWKPSSIGARQLQKQEDGREQCHVDKLNIIPRVVAAATTDNNLAGSEIRSAGTVNSSVCPTATECSSMELLNVIKHKMEAGPQEALPFLGNQSSTGLPSAARDNEGVVVQREKQIRQKKLESCSSSLETEDSGFGEDSSLSDSEVKDKAKPRKHSSNRPKVDKQQDNTHLHTHKTHSPSGLRLHTL